MYLNIANVRQLCHSIDTTEPTPLVDLYNVTFSCSLIFVLSTIHPENWTSFVTRILNSLREGGSAIVRDYGLYDQAMLRFSANGHKLSENFYARQDGTRAYYFSKGEPPLCKAFSPHLYS